LSTRSSTTPYAANTAFGCSGIKPSKFDVLIYVEFDDSLNSFEHYIFTQKEAETLPLSKKVPHVFKPS
jgi:hypothetical protein